MEKSELPFYNANRQLPAEVGKWYTPKPIAYQTSRGVDYVEQRMACGSL